MVDLILILILFVFLVYGCVKGFLSQILSFFGTLFAFIFAFIFCKKLAEYLIEHTEILSFFTRKFASLFGEFNVEVETAQVRSSLESSAFPEFLINVIVKAAESTGNAQVNLLSVVSETVAKFAVTVVSFIAIFIAIKLISLVLKLIVRIIKRSRIINGTDRLLGALLALIRGMSLIYTCLMIIDLVPLGFFVSVKEMITASAIGSFLSKYNVLTIILSPIVSKL